MKKARIVLAGIGLLAVIGGTMAVSAHKRSIQGLYFGTAAGTLPNTYRTGYTLSPAGSAITYATASYTTLHATFTTTAL